ncbi:hypothetical protein MKW98_005976, partial [Papaver atlanticum]
MVVTLLQVQVKGVPVCLRQMVIILQAMLMGIRMGEMDCMRLFIKQTVNLKIPRKVGLM